MKKAVFLGDGRQVSRVYYGETMKALRRELDFVAEGRCIGKEELASEKEALSDVEYVFSTWGMLMLTVEEIHEYLPQCKAVFYAAGSVQYFARPFLENGIAVHSAWAANGVPVAEYTFAQIVLATKGFFHRLHKPGSGYIWTNRNVYVDFPGNYDITVGIIGAGMIGKMVIERLHRDLDRVRVVVFDPFLSDEKAAALEVEKCTLEELFAQSDVISNHLANNPQTVGMLDAHLFDRMKPNTTFINTGRGAQVVEADMIAALQADPSRAAVLDVTYPEPPAEDSPLYTMDNVYLTPHIAGSLGNEVRRMGEYMLSEYRCVAAGAPTKYAVTLKMLETMA